MRTTLTLDDDVAAKLHEQSRRTGKPFKQVVNEVLRRGLHSIQTVKAKRFQVRTRPLRLRPGIDLDNIGDLLEHLEGPSHK